MINLFLSYSRANSTAMRLILGNLRALGFNVWVDVDGLQPGTSEWEDAIDQALHTVDGVIVLLSPEAKRSTWVNNEIRTALLLEKPIFPILLEGDEISAIPIGLRNTIYTDMRTDPANFASLLRSLSNQFDLSLPSHELEPASKSTIPHVQVTAASHPPGDVVSIGNEDMIERVPRRFPVGGVLAAGLGVAVVIAAVIFFSTRPPAEVAAEPTAEPSPTLTPTLVPSATPTPTLTPTLTPTATITPNPALLLAESASITTNEEWTPITRTIDGVEMALVPAGCFEMGTTATNEPNEYPVHTVCFEEPFWLDVYEVTNAQYGEPGFYAGDTRPRDSVTWGQAATFCNERGARLPTEAEWEYAARGPNNYTFPWGEDWSQDYAVWLANSGSQSQAVGFRATDQSWVGVFDLAGNVREWVHDWYDEDYYNIVPDGAIDPQGPFDGDQRVARGGSWFHGFPFDLRMTLRIAYFPDYTSTFTGFRCARDYP